MIRGAESHVTKLVLPRGGSFGNRVSVKSEIDRPLAIKLQNTAGDVVRIPGSENANTISLNGLEAGEYELVVTSEDHNRYVIATDFDFHEIVTRLNTSASDPADRTNHVLQPTSYAKQRSEVEEISIELPIQIDQLAVNDVSLTNLGIDANVDQDSSVSLQDDQLSLSDGGRKLTIRLDTNELREGVYRLEIGADSTGDEPLVITGNPNNGLFVLKGDWDGNGIVDYDDFSSIGYWFDRQGDSIASAPHYLDLDQSGRVDRSDLSNFQNALGSRIVFPDGTTATSNGIVDSEVVQRAVRSVANPVDSNGDGDATSLDAFRIINALSGGEVEQSAWNPLDTTRDGKVTALDALIVINHLETANRITNPSNIDAELASWPAIEETSDDEDWLDEFTGVLFG